MYKLFPEMQLLRVGHINTNYTHSYTHTHIHTYAHTHTHRRGFKQFRRLCTHPRYWQAIEPKNHVMLPRR